MELTPLVGFLSLICAVLTFICKYSQFLGFQRSVFPFACSGYGDNTDDPPSVRTCLPLTPLTTRASTDEMQCEKPRPFPQLHRLHLIHASSTISNDGHKASTTFLVLILKSTWKDQLLFWLLLLNQTSQKRHYNRLHGFCWFILVRLRVNHLAGCGLVASLIGINSLFVHL